MCGKEIIKSLKSTPNIIDLIQPGEFVRTSEYGLCWFHHKINEDEIMVDDGEEFLVVSKDEIIGIITNEKLRSIEYKVGE